MQTIVIIPTYNEKENVSRLLPALLSTISQCHVCVVDDNSPDGTAQAVKTIQVQYPGRVFLLERSAKQGLAAAYKAGFRWAIDQKYEAIIQMDADFSHRIEDLIKILQALQKASFVVGSRYIPEGKILNWDWRRRLISAAGNLYAGLILGRQLKDWTGGFNGWRTTVLKTLLNREIVSEGYMFQIELKARALQLGFDFQEIPITFEDRRVGQSKMSKKIIFEALWRVLWLKFNPWS